MASVSRRRYLGGAAVALSGLLAAACEVFGGTEDTAAPATTEAPVPPAPRRRASAVPGGSAAASQAKQPVTVVVRYAPVWSYQNTPEEELTKRFTEEHPHIEVQWEPWVVAQGIEGVRAVAAAGELPDVVQLWTNAQSEPVFQGKLAPLDRFIKVDRYDLGDFWPGCLEISTWRGELFGLHTEVNTNVIWYNQDLFQDAGVGAPVGTWQWPDLLASAQQLTSGQGAQATYGFALDMTSSFSVTIPWIWANGGDLFDQRGARSLVDQSQTQEALRWLVELRHTHAVWPTEEQLKEVVANERVSSLFEFGRLAMLYTSLGSKQRLLVEAPQLRYAIGEPPQGPARPANWLNTFLPFHLGSASAVGDDAWTFLRWWTGSDAQRAFHTELAILGRGLSFPGTDVPARKSLAEELKDWFSAATVAALAHAQTLPPHPKLFELLETYEQGFAPLWRGEQSVSEATAAVAQQHNAILAS